MVSTHGILEGLNPEQRQAAEAVRGPLCILAGAGSGKTTTITRRIALQVATGTFRPGQILAVTFTDKAAGQLRARLAALGASGVPARTFHAAALAQLRYFAGDPGRILASKAPLLRQIGNGLPRPYRFRPAGDLATEIEWARNRRLSAATYAEGLRDHEPPIPADLMVRVFRDYERRKRAAGQVDFEDLLELAIRLFEEDVRAREEFRVRYAAFTVDEYQDVNLLQQTLLERWLGSRDELCVVGDDYQSIYGFTGATPDYLLGFGGRFPGARVVRLEQNYRSTPPVLELANRLVPSLGGASKVLRPVAAEGPEPVVCRPEGSETAFAVDRILAFRREGIPLEEMAILFRTNARSADFEEALTEAGLPFQGASLLARQAARQLLGRLVRVDDGSPLALRVRSLAVEAGYLDGGTEGLGERELTRQNDLARLIRLAEDYAERGSAAEFVRELEHRFGPGGLTGVHLLTLHRAKGLEWDAVFLPRVEERELPIRQAQTDVAVAEERRLLYVGLTRARRHLSVTWSGTPSRFLAELGVSAVRRRPRPTQVDDDSPAFAALRAWRLERARSDEVPAYVVFHNATLSEIAEREPRTLAELASIPGVGSAKIDRYGPEVLAVLSGR